MKFQNAIATLKEIEGVQGSFVVLNPGRLLARDLPGVFADEFLSSAAPRLTRLWDTMGAVDRSIDQLVLRYDEHKLYLRPVVQGLLCVLTPLAVNMAALRMAANLVVKRLNPVLAEFDWEAAESVSAIAPNSTSAIAAPAEAGAPRLAEAPAVPVEAPKRKRTMVYRGRRYEL